MKKSVLFRAFPVLLFFLSVSIAFANKTSVTIEAPATAKIGEKVTVVIHVKHIGNTASHYTDWVTLKVNGGEVMKWTYTSSTLPKAQSFKLTYVFVVTGDLKLEAEGHCNLHGSQGIAAAAIKAIP